jgi:hypothetical protein
MHLGVSIKWLIMVMKLKFTLQLDQTLHNGSVVDGVIFQNHLIARKDLKAFQPAVLN